MSGASQNATVRRIAVLRALQLGDVLCAMPALQALREAHPGAHLALIGLPWARDLLPRYAGLVDELIEFPGYPGMPERPFDSAATAAFFQAMQDRRFDLTVQLHGDGTVSNVFVAMLGGARSIGAFRPGRWRPGPDYVPYPEHLSEIDRALAAIGAVHPGPPSAPHRFPLLPSDDAELAAVLPDVSAQPVACLHPGARDPRRRWSAERFAAVGDALVERGLRVLLTGGAGEREIHAAVLGAMRRPAETLVGRLALGGFGALLARSRLVVTNDTGASHLAAAVGAPAITIFVASDPARWAPPRAEHLVVGGPAARARAGPRHAGEASQTQAVAWLPVSVESVVAAAGTLLEAPHRHAA